MNKLRWLALIGGCLLSLASLAEYQALDKIIAIVDDDVITEADMKAKVAQIISNFEKQGKGMPPAEEINKQVLDRLIIESLQMQLARRVGVSITEDQLTEAVINIAQRNGLTLSEFRQRVISEGMTYENMREQIRRDMTLQQVQQGNLRSKIQISEQDVEIFLNSPEGLQMTTTRFHISHLLLPIDEAADTQSISEAQQALAALRTEIQSNIQTFTGFMDGKKFRQYMISGADLGIRTQEELPSLFSSVATKLDIGEISEPIRSGAGWHLVKVNNVTGMSKVVKQTRSRHILIKLSEVRDETQAKRLINSLYERIKKGEDFSLLAKEYSEDPGSALQGGDLNWSMPGQFVPAFEETLARLKIKEISLPFKSQYGWHIMQKMDERQHDMTEETQRNKAYQVLFERRFSEELDSWLLKIRDEAFVEIK